MGLREVVQRANGSSANDRTLLQQLKTLFPECVTDGAFDLSRLSRRLRERVDGDTELYELIWPGKALAGMVIDRPSSGVFVPKVEASLNWDTAKDLYIESENLEALKLLRKTYRNQVKLIYIDPPYNTGKEFVYNDNYHEPATDLLRNSNELEADGLESHQNLVASGRIHSNWLNMMYPRLRLAKELLRKDGFIFISIDDNEAHNLRCLMNEIFGEKCFVGSIVVQSNKRGQTYKSISKSHEYLLVYSQDDQASLFELNKQPGSLPYQDIKGPFDLWELRNRNPRFGKQNRPNLHFPIYVAPSKTDANGYASIALESSPTFCVEVYPMNRSGEPGCWRWSRDKIRAADLVSDGRDLVAKRVRSGRWNIYQKSRKTTTKPKSIWNESAMTNEQGTIELGQLGLAKAFEHPKPLGLLEKILRISTQKNDLVLDFFAGSGSLGHALWRLNAEDGGQRRFILIQQPEAIHREGFSNLAEIGQTRLRRAADKLSSQTKDNLGFRVWKLMSTSASQTLDTMVGEVMRDYDVSLTDSVQWISRSGVEVVLVGSRFVVCALEQLCRESIEQLRDIMLMSQAKRYTVIFRSGCLTEKFSKSQVRELMYQAGADEIRYSEQQPGTRPKYPNL